MEGREESCNGAQIPKKSKSLDLKSLYLTKENPNKSLKRVCSGYGDGDEKRNKRKKARKEVSLSSLENANGSGKKILNAEGPKGPTFSVQDSRELKSGVSKRLSCSGELKRVPFIVNGVVIHVPKRKRNHVGRKKSEVVQASNHATGQPSCKIGSLDQVPKLGSDDLSRGLESSKTDQKNEFKENRRSDSSSVLHVKRKEVHISLSVVNNGDSSLTKSRRKNRKQKTLASDRVRVAEEAKPLIDICKLSHDLHKEDEENLEENAARMLSSRFDPSCTGFSSSNKSSTLPSASGLSFLLSSGGNTVNHGSKSWLGSESASLDAANKSLRPRRQNKHKGNARKRRHFYEILSGFVDAHWVLNRRIKVFWPLDQSWYYGSVSDYDSDKKLHHVKYDDRDEEWIDLQTERFKLLLLRSEVPGNAKGKRASAKSRRSDQKSRSKSRTKSQRREAVAEDDRFNGSCMDSEPIISWLARSHRLKSSHFDGTKRQKTSTTSRNTSSPLLYDEPVKVKGLLANSDSELQDKLGNNCREKSSLRSATSSKDGSQSIVYVRSRLRSRPRKSPHKLEQKCASTSVPCSVPCDPVVGGAVDVKESIANRVEVEGPLWFTCNAGVSEIFWDIVSTVFKFDLKFPLSLVLNDCFELESLWLPYAVLLHQYGAVMIKWPRVCLEMLFVDNVVGLRFLLFEGCMKMLAAFVILVLRVFHQPSHQGKHIDLQLPVTSIGFKFFSVHATEKPLVFAFYNFSEVNSSKWRHLDSKLKRHCLLSKQLHLSECTYDNIQAFQNGSTGYSMVSIKELSPVKVKQKRTRPGINIMGVSKMSTQVDIHPSLGACKRKLSPFTLPFAAAPTFFLSLHLKLLIEQQSSAHTSFCDHAPVNDQEGSGLLIEDCSSNDDCFKLNSDINPGKDMMTLSKDTAGDELSGADLDHVTGPSTAGDQNISQNYQDIGLNGSGTSIYNAFERQGVTQSPERQSHHSGLELGSSPLIQKDNADDGSHSFEGDLSVQIPSVDQFEKTVDDDLHAAQHSPDFSWNIHRSLIQSPNQSAPRSSWNWNWNGSSLLGFQSLGLSDGKAYFRYSDFRNGPKRPRTQVSYSVPSSGHEFSSRNRSHHQKGLPHKRIRKAKEKKSIEVARGCEKNFECISCEANVLITLGDKGWRESGANIVLEVYDHNEWKLSVKLSGITRYSYKAHQFIQPGSTNRFTNYIMWKGGKDWILEFPDRSHWTLFKEMHEECYNRNIRATSVKNIPIPGVHLIEENDDNGPEITFVRSCKYVRQIETDVAMALNPSHVLYDMDSEDEQWISNIHNFDKDNGGLNMISEEVFEKAMDMFEKVAYSKKSDHFTPNEIQEVMANVGLGPLCIVKNIYDHWQHRREKNGMALIRHFQPPLWERYQQQLKEWEVAMTKNNTSSEGGVDKVASLEKPPMFAFCMKPRGLEQQNKVFKHRSQKRIPLSGYTKGILDHDGLQTFGKRSNGFAIGDDNFLYPYDILDDSPLPQTSPRVFSSRDAGSMRYYNDGYYRNHNPKMQRSKSKKLETFNYHSNDLQMTASCSQRMPASGKRNGVSRWNDGYLPGQMQMQHLIESPQKHRFQQFDGSYLDEYRLRDAKSTAQHAHKMAKSKRERANRLLNRADLAIHRAVTALMVAEAMKTSDGSVADARTI